MPEMDSLNRSGVSVGGTSGEPSLSALVNESAMKIEADADGKKNILWQFILIVYY
jgi:hypothetical protein